MRLLIDRKISYDPLSTIIQAKLRLHIRFFYHCESERWGRKVRRRQKVTKTSEAVTDRRRVFWALRFEGARMFTSQPCPHLVNAYKHIFLAFLALAPDTNLHCFIAFRVIQTYLLFYGQCQIYYMSISVRCPDRRKVIAWLYGVEKKTCRYWKRLKGLKLRNLQESVQTKMELKWLNKVGVL